MYIRKSAANSFQKHNFILLTKPLYNIYCQGGNAQGISKKQNKIKLRLVKWQNFIFSTCLWKVLLFWDTIVETFNKICNKLEDF